MRWVFFHGVFGDWGWEQLDDSGSVIAESRGCFEYRSEAEADAAAHGYVAAAPANIETAAAAPHVENYFQALQTTVHCG